MKTVEIPGVGVVDFPDDMPDEEIASVISSQAPVAPEEPEEQDQARPDPEPSSVDTSTIHGKLQQKLIDRKVWNSASSALEIAANKEISNDGDGWRGPIANKTRDVNGLVSRLVSGPLGALDALDQKFSLGSYESDLTDVLTEFQADGGYTTEEVKKAWSDLGNLTRSFKKDEPPVRVLFDGSLIPNMASDVFLDEEKARKAINESGASEAMKAYYNDNLPKIMSDVVDQKIKAYETLGVAMDFGGNILTAAFEDSGMKMGKGKISQFLTPEEWASRNGRQDDYGTPKFMQDYETAIDEAGTFSKAAWKASNIVNNGVLKVSSQFAGLAALATGSEGAARYAGELSGITADTHAAMPSGLGATALEEVPSLVMMMSGSGLAGRSSAFIKELGMGAQLAKGGAAAAAAKEAIALAAQRGASVAAVTMSGAQSAGLTMASQMAEGDTSEEARRKAWTAGLNTAIITGMFQSGGFGGVERVAAGKAVSDITVRDLMTSVGSKAFWPRLRGFAGDVLKAATGEASEEMVDELTGAFATADPDDSLASAWDNAEKAGILGGILGMSVHVGMGALAPGRPITPGELRTQQAAADAGSRVALETTAATLENVGAPETAAALREMSTPTNEAPSAPALETVKMDAVTPVGAKMTIGNVEVDTKTSSGPALAEAVFGPAAKGMEYTKEAKPDRFSLAPMKGTDRKVVTFDGAYTNRAYDPSTRTFTNLLPAESELLASRQEGMLRKGETFQTKLEETVEVKASPSADTKIPSTGNPDSIDTSPAPASAAKAAPEATPAPAAKPAPVALTAKPAPADVETPAAPAPPTPAPAPAREAVKAPATREEAVVAAVTGSARSSNLLKQELSGSAAYEQIFEKDPNADEDAAVKQVIADAVNGSASAQEALSTLTPDAKQDLLAIVSDATDHSIEGKLGLEADQSIGRFLNGPLGAPLPVDASATAGGMTSAQAKLDNVIQRERAAGTVSEYVDSTTEAASPGKPTINRELPVGSVINGTDDAGNIVSQRVVTHTATNPDGTVRHYLQNVPMSEDASVPGSTAQRLPSYEPNPLVVGRFRTVANLIRANIGNLAASRPQVVEGVKRMITAQFSAMVSNRFANESIVFGGKQGAMVAYSEAPGKPVKITVNEEYFTDRITQLVKDLSPYGEAAVDAGVRDFVNEVAQTAYHEMAHEVAIRTVDPLKLVSAVKQLLAQAKKSKSAAKIFLAEARYRLSFDGAFGGGTLNTLSDADILALFSGETVNGMTMDTETLNNELWATGHELLARLQEKLRTGTDVDQVRMATNRWVRLFLADGNLRQRNSMQVMAMRFAEIANRLAESISRFLRTHRRLGKLPADLAAHSLALDAAMQAGGIVAPDVFGVQGGALRAVNNTLSHATRLTTRGWGHARTQKALRREVQSIRLQSGDAAYMPITINPVTFELEARDGAGYKLTSAQRSALAPLLAELNSPERVDVLRRTSAAARDLATVLRHLNGGRSVTSNSKILDTFDPARVGDRMGAIFNSITQNTRAALGMTAESFLQRFNGEMLNRTFDGGSMPSYEGFETLFTEGALQDHAAGRAAVENVRLTRETMAQARTAAAAAPESTQAAQAYESSVDAFTRAYDAFKGLLDSLAAQDTPVGERIRQNQEINRRSMDRGLREIRNRWNQRPVDSIEDLVRLHAANPNAVDSVVRSIIPGETEFRRAMSAIESASETFQAANRLRDFREQLEYLVMGGRKPDSLRAYNRKGWLSGNVRGVDRGLSFMPITIGRTLRPTEVSNTQQVQADVLGRAMEEGYEGEAEVWSEEYGTVKFRYSPSEAAVGRNITQEEVVEVKRGNITASSLGYRNIVSRLATEVKTAATNISRIFGVEQASERSQDTSEFKDRMTDNARELNRGLVNNLIEQFFRFGKGVSEDTVNTGGFPVQVRMSENGTRSLYYGNTVIGLPVNPDIDTTDGFNSEVVQLLRSGAVSELLANVHRFMRSMESDPDGGSTVAVMAHEGGLTPAGLAYQLVAPKFLEFLALTKGQNGKLQILDALIDAARTPEIRDSLIEAREGLAPGFESDETWAESRRKLQGNLWELRNRFWELRRHADVANDLYSTTVRRLRGRRGVWRSASDLSRNGSFPLDPSTLNSLEFEGKLRRNLPGKKQANDKTLVSLVEPVRARRFLDLFRASDAEAQEVLGRGITQDMLDRGEVEATNFDSQAYQPDSGSRIEAEDFNEDNAANAQRRAEDQRAHRARIRSSALMALFGGDVSMVLRYVHGPEFAQVVSEGSEPVWDYNLDALDSAIIDQLETLHAEEVGQGVVGTWWGDSYDAAIRALSERHPDHAPMLEHLLANGAEVTNGITSDLSRSPENAPAYDASARSVLLELVGRIPGITLVNGDARWENSQDDGRIPSVAFINDGSAPTLVFPYRNTTPTEQEYTTALTEVFRWMADNGGVDVTAIAQRLTAPARSLSIHTKKWLLRGAMERASTQDLSPADEYKLEAMAFMWDKLLDRGVASAVRRSSDDVIDFFNSTDPNAAFRLNHITGANAPSIVAAALVRPEVKRAMMLSLYEDPGLVDPASEEVSNPSYGMLVGSDVSPEVALQYFQDYFSNMPAGAITDDRGQTIQPDEDGFESAAMRHALEAWESSLEKAGLDPAVEIDKGWTPLQQQQASWLNAILHDVMDGITPVSSAPGLQSGPVEPQPLSQMEARQLLGVLDPDYVRSLVADLSQSRADQWNLPDRGFSPTVGDMMALSGKAADLIRQQFSEGFVHAYTGDLGTEERLRNYGVFRYSDPVTGRGFNRNSHENNRVKKGKIATLIALGMQFDEVQSRDGESTKMVGILTADPAMLEQRAAAAGRMEYVGEGENRLTVWEYERQAYAREVEDERQIMDDLRNTAVRHQLELENTTNALNALESMRDDLTSQRSSMDLLESLRSGLVSAGSAIDVDPILAPFFSGRADFVDRLATLIHEDFVDNNTRIARSMDSGRVAGTSRSPQMFALTQVSLENTGLARNLSNEIDSARRTLTEQEGRLRPDWAREERGSDWYRSLPQKDSRVLQGLRRGYEQLIGRFNDVVAGVALETSRVFPDIINRGDYLLSADDSPGVARQRTEDFLAMVGRLRSPSAVHDMASRAALRQSMETFEYFDPSMGVGGMSLDQVASSRRIEIPSEASAELASRFDPRAPRDEQVRIISSILEKHLFSNEDSNADAITYLKAELQHRLQSIPEALDRSDLSSLMEEFSERLADSTGLTSLEIATTVKGLMRDVLAGKVETDRLSLEKAMMLRSDAQARFNERAGNISASIADNDGSSWYEANLIGSPDDVAISQRVLSRYGRIWSQLQQNNRHNSEFLDGYDDARMAALSADELMEFGSRALTETTGQRFNVVDGILEPDNITDRIGMILDRQGIPRTTSAIEAKQAQIRMAEFENAGIFNDGVAPEWQPLQNALGAPTEIPPEKQESIGLLTDTMMKWLEDSGLFTSTKKDSATLGNADPVASMRDRYHRMLQSLLTWQQTGALKGKGVQQLEDGTATPDIHSRISEAVAGLRGTINSTKLKAAYDAYISALAQIKAEESVDAVTAGFVQGESLTGGILRGLMHHQAKVRMMFARALRGQWAANSILSFVEYGHDGMSGRNGFRGQSDLLGEMMRDRMAKHITGPNRFEKMSTGYMASAVKSYIMAGGRNDLPERARHMIRMFDQADAGLLSALRVQLANTADMPMSIEKALAATGNTLKSLSTYLTEETFKMMEERAVYRKVRDELMPHIQAIADHNIGVAEGLAAMDAAIDPQARAWGKFLENVFTHYRSAFIDEMRLRGENPDDVMRQPLVPMSWQSFNRNFAEEREVTSLLDTMSLRRAQWMKYPNRSMVSDRVELLSVNGAEAPLRILNDMLYRINVSSGYDAFHAVVGETAETNLGDDTTLSLSALDGNEGRLSQVADEVIADSGDRSVARSAARAIAYMGQEMVRKDMTNIAPRNRFTQVMHELMTLGATRALISASQIWRQTVPALIGYIGARDGFLRNSDVLGIGMSYISSRVGHAVGRALQRSQVGEEPTAPAYHQLVDDFIRRYASHIFVRSADGNTLFLDDVSRIRPSSENRPPGRVVGRARGATDAAAAPVKFVHNNSVRLAKWMLEKSIASPEKVISRTIFMHQLLREVNNRLASEGSDPTTVEKMLLDHKSMGITPDMLQRAQIAVTDMMAEGDSSKKGKVFQPTKSTLMEILRGGFTTFANHQISMSSNSFAAYKMLRSSNDPATRKEARRLITSSVGQNVLFQVMRYEMMVHAIVETVGRLLGDEEDRRKWKGMAHGIMPNDKPGDRRSRFAYWASLLLGGSYGPIGWSAKEGWSDDRASQQYRQMSKQVVKEFITQAPYVGMLAATTAGSALLDTALSRTVMNLLPGDDPKYERAGIVLPKSLGGEGKGADAKGHFEKFLYGSSAFFLDDVQNRSTMMAGAAMAVDPLAVMSNVKGEADWLDYALLWGAQAPFLPRELRSEGQNLFRENTDARIWHSSWKPRQKRTRKTR